jgi:rod shape determining protein RodA
LALIYIITIVLLLAVLIFSQDVGPKRWLRIGDFSFQPSEFAKLTIVLITAALWSKSRTVLVKKVKPIHQVRTKNIFRRLLASRSLKTFGINFALILPIIFLIYKQPSLGNTIITIGLWLLIIFTMAAKTWSLVIAALVIFAGINIPLAISASVGIATVFGWEHIAISALILLVGLLVSPRWFGPRPLLIAIFATSVVAGASIGMVWNNFLTEYQRDRVVAFANPESDPLGAEWQVTQAQIAIASGQIFGKGILQGTQTSSGLLPYAYTDFAYAAIVEQFGLVGSIFVLGLMYALIVRTLWIAKQVNNSHHRLIIFGVVFLIAINMIINVAINLKLIPVTGVPLPLISYGGSAVIVNLIGLGLVQMSYTEIGSSNIKAEKLA